MKRYRNRDHDDEDRDRILKDGERLRVPLTLMDSVQRAIAIAGGSLRVTDGQGGTRGLHRPGFRLDARKTTTVRDPRGRLKETWETEEEEENGTSDAMRARDQAYADYDVALINAYKTGGSAAPEEGDDQRVCPECEGTGLDQYGEECEGCSGTGYEQSAEEVADNATTTTRRLDSRQISRDHQQRMARLYSAYDSAIREAWQGDK